MCYTGDPANNPLDRVRILCTDTNNDEILIEQSVLEWYYLESGKDEKKAAIKALKYLLFQVAKMGDEKVGGVYLRNSSRFKSLKAVYDDLVKSSVSGLPYAGGINQCDIDMRRQNPCSVKKYTEYGDAARYEGRDYCNRVNGVFIIERDE